MNTEIHTMDSRCPTCRNMQPWSDECRRCGTDLTLLRCLAEESAQLQRTLLASLAAKDDSLAELILQRLTQISPTPMMEQLLQFVKSSTEVRNVSKYSQTAEREIHREHCERFPEAES